MPYQKCDSEFESQICLSSGPCSKPCSWQAPEGKYVGRSHRSEYCLEFIQKVLSLQREILCIPNDYRVAFVAGSSTGAMEMLIWNLIGAKAVDILDHCVFSHHWAHDIINELKLPNARVFSAEFPNRANTDQINFDNDVVFCMTSTTSGVTFHDTNWIPKNRNGLIISDVASAVYCMPIDWNKIDAAAFSWQKGLGGEAGFGTIVLSPRAIDRLQQYNPDRAIPRIFRIKNFDELNEQLFAGHTINTPSMLCLEDYYNVLVWAKNIGGAAALYKRVTDNYFVVCDWLNHQNDFSFLVTEQNRAYHIACLDICHNWYQKLSEENKWKFLTQIVTFCENWGCDFLGHIWTHPHLRLWCGPTIDASDLGKFLPHLGIAYNEIAKTL